MTKARAQGLRQGHLRGLHGPLKAYLPTYLQLFYYSKVRAAEHDRGANRGGLGRYPTVAARLSDPQNPVLRSMSYSAPVTRHMQ